MFFKMNLPLIAFFLATSPAHGSTQSYCSQPGPKSSYCYAFSHESRPAVEIPTEGAATNVIPSDGNSSAYRLKQELLQVGVERFTSTNYKPGVVRHIVLFRYKSPVTDAVKIEVRRRFLALQSLATRDGQPYIVSIETGAENSGEGADQGLEQGFIVTFKSQGDRNFYVGQPVVTDPRYYDGAHQAFKDFVGPLLDQNGVLVFDFSAGE